MQLITSLQIAFLLCSGLSQALLDSEKLNRRHEALLLFKRQDAFCLPGYYQCPVEFGGGCCAQGRVSRTTSLISFETSSR